jgi:hypothetical protein
VAVVAVLLVSSLPLIRSLISLFSTINDLLPLFDSLMNEADLSLPVFLSYFDRDIPFFREALKLISVRPVALLLSLGLHSGDRSV